MRGPALGTLGRKLALALLLSTALLAPPSAPVFAQAAQNAPATLVADSLAIAGDNKLVAEGNVEIFHRGIRLRASRIVYDEAADRLEITGPIRLTEADDRTIILGSQAELSADMTEGILKSARIVLNRQLQMSAAELRRSGGRYTEMTNSIASACKVCEGSSTPLWEIRASRVIHDQEKRQLTFSNAQMRVLGIPILYVPRLRMPDPTLDRLSGFLTPGLFSSTNLGAGVTLPYFITLGPSRDLTVTPLLTNSGARSVDLRYRQAFRTGNLLLQGALSRDAILPDQWRGYLAARGNFRLPADFKLLFDGEVQSDDAYFSDYRIEDSDRLRSNIEVTRTRREEYISGRVIGFRTLRDSERDAIIPSTLQDLRYARRLVLPALGGDSTLSFRAYGQQRYSDSPFDPDGDGISDGRDLARGSARLDWRRDIYLPGGLVGAGLAELRADVYGITQDAVWNGQHSRLHSAAGLELRWPLVRSAANGGRDLLEPKLQLLWSPSTAATVPGEDSALAELDEGNLFSFSRFPGEDRVETGFRANLGLTWTRYSTQGWTLGASVGRILRADPVDGFSVSTGLGADQSDWLAAISITSPDGLRAAGRMMVDEDMSLTRGEMRVDQLAQTYALGVGYIWADTRADPGLMADTSELLLDGSYFVTPQWQARGMARYDFMADRPSRTGLGLRFHNECLYVDVSLSRRYTSSTSVKPVTTVQVQMDLLGFGGRATGPARVCRG